MEEDRKELIAVELSPAELSRLYPTIRAFDPKADKHRFDLPFDDDISDIIASREQALELAVSFLLTGRGEVTFNELEDGRYESIFEEDEAFKRLEHAKVIFANLFWIYGKGQGATIYSFYLIEQNGRPGGWPTLPCSSAKCG